MSLPRAEATLLGPYRLLHPLGRGGMGEVWAAQHVQCGEPAAVKLITASAARDPRYQHAFRREVRAVAGLDHPGIVRVHDQGRINAAASATLKLPEGAPWLAMELLGGGSLRQRGAVLAWPYLYRVLDALLAALAHAHARGVIHRDLKPDNVLASADHQRIVLTDFGVAHAADRDTGDLTDSAKLGETVGTPAYMAPEQIRGHWRDQGPWTDLYALGCMAWELVTGAPPFVRSAGMATMLAQLSQPLPPLVPRVSVPVALLSWLTRLLAKAPEQRYAHAADARLALNRFAARPGVAFTAVAPERGPRGSAAAPSAVEAATLAEGDAAAADGDPFAEALLEPQRGPVPPPAAPHGAPAHVRASGEAHGAGHQDEARADGLPGRVGIGGARSEGPGGPAEGASADHSGSVDLDLGERSAPGTDGGPAQHTPRLDPESMEPAVLVTGLLTAGSVDPALAATLASDAAVPVPQPALPFSVGPFDGSEGDLRPPPAGPMASERAEPGGRGEATGATADPRPACPPDWRALEWSGAPDLHLIAGESTATLELEPEQARTGEVAQVADEGPRSGSASLALSTHGLEADEEPQAPGLGLFGLRTIPFVGRETERDALWAGLRRVTEVGEAHGVLLMGPSGYGKTRLTDWLAERAQEVGVATAVRVVASPSRGPADGIGAMVRRVVRGQGLERGALFDRIWSWLAQHGGPDTELAELLTALVHPHPVSLGGAGTPITRDTAASEMTAVVAPATDPPDADASSDPFGSGGLSWFRPATPAPSGSGPGLTTARFSGGAPLENPPNAELLTAATRFINRLASLRPVVLVLEDVQWAPQVLHWARQLLSHAVAAPGPVLVLVTLRTDAVRSDPTDARVEPEGDPLAPEADRPPSPAPERHPDRLLGLEALRRLPNLGVLSVGPLPANSRHAMMQAMLGLNPGLARRIDARTGGNPLFAVQLVGAWIERGLLEQAPDGVRLRDGVDPDAVPFDLVNLWRERIEGVLHRHPPGAAAALELAAALGQQVSGSEWRATCKLAELPVPVELVEALLDAGLATAEREGHREGFSFVHAMLREAVLDRARQAGRLEGHHRTCARMLALRPQAAVERLARHLAAGDRHLAALEPLGTAIDIALEEGDAHGASHLLELRRVALDGAQVAQEDHRRAEDWLRAARSAFLLSDFERMASLVQRADAAASEHGWHAVRARLAMTLGTALRERGQPVEARVQLEKAAALAGEIDDRHNQARAWEGLVPLLSSAGEREVALGTLLSAQGAFEAVGDAAGAGRCELALAQLFKQSGRLAEAARHNREAAHFFSRGPHHDGLARVANQRGELARLQGNLDAAAEAYREALARWEVRDARNAVFARANLALVLMESGRFADALPLLLRARRAFEQQRRWPMVAALVAVGVACRADAGDWAHYDLEIDQTEDLVRRTDLVDADTAHMLARAGHLAAAAGFPARAARAFRLARDQWRRLDRPDRAAVMEAALEGAPPREPDTEPMP